MDSNISSYPESFIANHRSSHNWVGDSYRRSSERNNFQYFESSDHKKIMHALKKCSCQDFAKFPKNHFVVISGINEEFYRKFCELPETFREKITFILTIDHSKSEIDVRNRFAEMNLPTPAEIKAEPLIIDDFIDGLTITRDGGYISWRGERKA